MKIKTTLLVLLLGACAWRSSAQTFDSSGDGMLNGAYYMRQVFYYYVPGQTNDLGETINIQGTITFNGSGAYSFNGSVLDSAVSSTKAELFTTIGTYVISASGQGYVSAIDQEFPNDRINGFVSHGVFIGSSTENAEGYNDLYIAAPISSSPPTNATLTGSYTVAYMDPTYLPTSSALPGGDALFTMTADGQGNIGAVNVTSYIGNTSTATTQSLSGVTYAFSNGAADIKFGGTRNATTLIAGSALLYISPDGNFIFGGSYDGWDMFVGVRAATSTPTNFTGLYYQAGFELDEAATNSGFSPFDSYYGAFQAFSGNIIGHQRLSSVSPTNFQSLKSLLIYGGSDDFSYFDSYTLNSDGSSEDGDFAQHYVSSADGTVRIGYGVGPYLSLNVAFQAPPFSGSGVYLSPVGVVNAASSAPFTAQVAAGEFLTLYGSGLAPTTASASLPFPKLFNGVQVLINGLAAPISYVSPTQISIVVPYLISPNLVAQIYVNNNGSYSNVVTEYTGSTSVGVFTNNPVGGIGYAAALHPDESVISKSSPAQVGETVAVYLSGMGVVSQPVPDGQPAPSNPLSITTAQPEVFLLDTSGHYLQASVSFSGLAPGYAGLYQINFTVPKGLDSGNAYLEIIGPDSDTFEALLPLSTIAGVPADAAKSLAPRALPHRRWLSGKAQ
jgi:uncharacterized protein (TIGR03437 family)